MVVSTRKRRRPGDHHRDHVGDRRHDLLAVVEDQQRRRAADLLDDPDGQVGPLRRGPEQAAVGDRVPNPEGGPDLGGDALRGVDAGQLDEVHHRLLGEPAHHVGEPGLAEPAGAHDRGDPRRADRLRQGGHVVVAADQAAGVVQEPVANRAVLRTSSSAWSCCSAGPGSVPSRSRTCSRYRSYRSSAAGAPRSAASLRQQGREQRLVIGIAGQGGLEQGERLGVTAEAGQGAAEDRAGLGDVGARLAAYLLERAVVGAGTHRRPDHAPRPRRGPGPGRRRTRRRAPPRTCLRRQSASTASSGTPSR